MLLCHNHLIMSSVIDLIFCSQTYIPICSPHVIGLTDSWSFDKCSMCVAPLHYCVWFCLCLGVNLPNLCYFLRAGHNSRLNSGTRSVSEQVQHLQSSASPAFSRLLLLNLCSCKVMLNSMHDFEAVSTKSMSSLVFDFVIYSCLSARAPAVLVSTLGDISKHMYWKFWHFSLSDYKEALKYWILHLIGGGTIRNWPWIHPPLILKGKIQEDL